MLCRAKNGALSLGNRNMDYVSFGRGEKTLVVLPGLGDGLRTVRGTAFPLAFMYRAFAKRFTVCVFSRPHPLEAGCSTRDMARDALLAMDALGIGSASVMGISQGGMIAQRLAACAPERVEKLVLAVTLARPNDTLRAAVAPWIAMARRGDYRQLMIDTAEKSYSQAYLRAHRWLFPLPGRVGKPRDFTRFIRQAEACLGHDAYDALARIACPTLVLGGSADNIVGAGASREIAARISGSELYLYDGLGHTAYEEARDFNERALDFLLQSQPS